MNAFCSYKLDTSVYSKLTSTSFNFVTNSRRDEGGMEMTETWENFVNLGKFCTSGKICEVEDMRRNGNPFRKIYFEQVYWEPFIKHGLEKIFLSII